MRFSMSVYRKRLKSNEIIALYQIKASKLIEKTMSKPYLYTNILISDLICCKNIPLKKVREKKDSYMAKKDYSEYQKATISNYYKNLDTIMLHKLSALVSELYIAEAEFSNTDKLWRKVRQAMEKLKIPDAILEHIMEKKSVEILAKNLQEWLNKSK
jgi:hypothetical protein